jgi:aminopeptidase N
VIHRADYQPPAWLVPEIALDFALSLTETRVQATLSVERNPAGDGARTLRLDGDGLRPQACPWTACRTTTGAWKATRC